MLTIEDEAQGYVSRAALKLKHGLSHFGISARGKNCLDIGASTGGFTQVLLEEGAAHVTAIDVGHGQMKLEDPRITLIEGLNARDLSCGASGGADRADRLRRELHLAEAGVAACAGAGGGGARCWWR